MGHTGSGYAAAGLPPPRLSSARSNIHADQRIGGEFIWPVSNGQWLSGVLNDLNFSFIRDRTRPRGPGSSQRQCSTGKFMTGQTLSRKIAIISCIAVIPASIWLFQSANRAAFPSRSLTEIWGPQKPSGVTSSTPDYIEWDIATMILMAATCILASLYLLYLCARRLCASSLEQRR